MSDNIYKQPIDWDKGDNCFRVSDLPDVSDLKGKDLFLLTHSKDDYGNYDSQKITFNKVGTAIKKRFFQDEIDQIYDNKDNIETNAKNIASNLNLIKQNQKNIKTNDDEISATKDRLTEDELSISSNKDGILSNLNLINEISANYSKVGHKHLSSDITDFPLSVSHFINDSNYLTEELSEEKFYKKEDVNDLLDKKVDNDDLSNYYTSLECDDKFLTDHQSLSDYYTSSQTDEKLELKADKTDIPTNVSQLSNDVPYLSAHQSLDGYATQEWVKEQGYVTASGEVDLTDYVKKSENVTLVFELEDGTKKTYTVYGAEVTT